MTVSNTPPKRKVLLTGGGGRIGKHVIEPLREHFDLRLFDRTPVYGDSNTFIGTLQDIESLKRAMEGQDAVIHLAATSDVAPFLEELVPNNVVGLFNTLEAAVAMKVRRFVFASSCQAVLGRLKGPGPAGAEAMAHPCSLYGATKGFGEMMGSWYYERHKLEFVALRIGGFQSYEDADREIRERPDNTGVRALWLSPRDAVELFRCSVEAPKVKFCIAGGTSIVAQEWLSLKEAREQLGYIPQDDVAKIGGAARR